MLPNLTEDRPDPKTVVLAALARLRAAFPLEARLLAAEVTVRSAYAQTLRLWLGATPPQVSGFSTETLTTLTNLDAIVPGTNGIGCYPFSAQSTGIRVTWPAGTVNAMCAIDALAIARLAAVRTHIDATCTGCGTRIAIQVEENGGLNHDQTELARVLWLPTATTLSSCSQGLCRQIRFICRACPEPESGERFTLPQATAIANAFFAFQRALLASRDSAA